MAAIGSEPTIPLNVSPIMAAAAPREPIVTPNAVAAMADAFRSGQITTADIIQRFGEHAKAKQKAELSTLQEVTSPEAQESRRLAREAGDVKAKAEIALAPLAKQKQEAELKAAIYEATIKGSGVEDMHNALVKAGWPVEINPQTGPTESDRKEITRRFAVLQRYVAAKTKAADVADKAKADFPSQTMTVDTPSGPQVVEGRGKTPFVTYQGQQLDPEKFKRAVQFNAQMQQLTPAAYDALGQPDAPSIFEDIAPGAVDVDTRPVAGPAPAPTPAAVTPQVGQPFDAMAQVTSVKPAPGATKKSPAETAQELASVNALGNEINAVRSIVQGTQNVVGPGRGSVVGTALGTAGAIVGVESSQERRNKQRQLEIFKSQKVLEGAQKMKGNLSDKDIRFLTESIPQLIDDESVWLDYLNKAEQMNEATRKILQGELPKGYSVLDSGPTAPSAGGESRPVTGGTMTKGADGVWKFIPGASTNTPPAGAAPIAPAGSPSTSLVEPKPSSSSMGFGPRKPLLVTAARKGVENIKSLFD